MCATSICKGSRVTTLGLKQAAQFLRVHPETLRQLNESDHKATLEMDKAHLRWLDPFLGGKQLDSISRAVVDHILEARQAEGVTNATVNRTLEVLRAILRRCINEWEWLDKAPQVRMLKEPTRRIRYI